jgi:1-acyl-sn-glycerol-3-phosphate acyltransferase
LRMPSVHDVTDEGHNRVAVDANDTALIQYTSGSTGDPKGVELTHAAVLANIRAAAAGCALGDTDVLVSWLPLYHDMGLIAGWLMPLLRGVPTVVMSPLAFLSRPSRWLRALSDYGGTCSVAPNFAFDLCTKRIDDDELASLDLSRVRAILNGAEPILPSTLDRFAARFAPCGLKREVLFCAYGLAENMVAVAFAPVTRGPLVDRNARVTLEEHGTAIATEDPDALQFVGVGQAVPGHEIQVVDERGVPVPDRQRGVVRFRGPSTFKGYYRRPDATALVKREDGWVDTGDLGYLADGELFIVGRVKDIIIKGGRNYHPHEIEEAAATVRGIRLGCVAAFAQRDETQGTEQIVVVAETRERDPLAREMLTGMVTEAITARVGVPPDRVVLAPPGAVPKTSSGKIQRSECRRLWQAGELERARGSFARQALGLLVRGLPSRIGLGLSRIGRALFGVYAITAIVSACFVCLVLCRLAPAGATARRLSCRLARVVMTLAALRPKLHGVVPEGAGIIVANHGGYLDFLICAAALPSDVRFVIKGELREVPLLGAVLRRTGHVFIDRHSTARSLADLDAVRTLLRDGQRVVLFPEGTFSSEVGMRPFKLGAFRLAAETGVPIVPIAIRGSRKALRDGTWLPRHIPIELEVLAPLHASGTDVADIVRLRDASAEAIAAKIDEPRLHAASIVVPGA